MDFLKLLMLATAGSLCSLIGGLLVLHKNKLSKSIVAIAAPFSAGALIAAAFSDLLPEALHEGTSSNIFIWTVVGIGAFFVLERRLRWFHHHHDSEESSNHNRRTPIMLVVGDTLHNAIDGAAIAFSFIADPSLGIITTIVVALHEIPQEIGDFGLLLKYGWSRKKVLLVNILNALSAVITAAVIYLIGRNFEDLIAPALALTAGVLLYVALSDIIPAVHEHKSNNRWLDPQIVFFIAGLLVVWFAVNITHSIAHNENQENGHSSVEKHHDESKEYH